MSTELSIDIPELIVLLKGKNISIKLKDNNIELVDPDKNLNQELITQIKIRKSEILEFLSKYQQNEDYRSIPLAKKKELYALSSMQKRLYFLWEMDKSLTNYNMPNIVVLEKPISKEKIISIIKELCQRHEMFRASFHYYNGNHCLKIEDYALPDIDCIETNEENVLQIFKNFVKPFDLSKAPLMRICLIDIAKREQLLLIDMHHIITDGVSNNILIKEFFSLCNGKTLDSLKVQYKDFTEWQNDQDYKKLIEGQEKYWLDLFSDEITTLQLPTDFPRPKYQNFSGGDVSFTINKSHTNSLQNITKSNGSTLFITLLSIFNVLLYKLTNQEDIVIGAPVAGRNHPDLGNIIGFFVNTLALRNKPKSETTFIEFCEQVKESTFKAFDNQDYEFGRLVDKLNVVRDTSRNPIFDIMLSLLNHWELHERQKSKNHFYEFNKTAQFDLTLFCSEKEGEILCTFNYRIDLFKETTIKRFAQYFQNVVESVSVNVNKKISDIEILSENERKELLLEYNNTRVNYPKDKTIVDLFSEQVKRTPNNIAVKFANQTIKYDELDRRSTQLAVVIKKNGVKSGHVVGLLMDRSIETIIGMLAILKAGAGYLPIDINYPDDRIKYIISDSGTKVILTSKELRNDVGSGILKIFIEDLEKQSDEVIEMVYEIKPSDLCYVIYTSGTTGNPKGVMIEHRNVVRLFFNDKFQFDFNSNDVWTMFHSHCFDFSVWEIYGALLFGGKLIVIPKMVAIDTVAYLKILKEEKVTILNQTPSAFYNLIREEVTCADAALNLRWIIFGGEALSPRKLKKWKEKYPSVKLINMFGITETTVHVSYKEIGNEEIENDTGNIGKPIPTLSIYLFDKHKRLVPRGVLGEIYVGGAGVSRGYLGKKELTEERFVKNPYDEQERLYKSGDLARILSNGDLEYVGRIDNQVQLRGFRVELGEIENQLLTYHMIQEVVVLAREREGNKYLVAYYVSDEEIEVVELKAHLSLKLPDYMLPSYFVRIETIPLTSNGKIDRSALPEPEVKAGEDYIPPRNEIESKIVEIWSDALNIAKEEISVGVNFFDIGGNSISLLKVNHKIKELFKIELSVIIMFELPTVSDLAKHIMGDDKSIKEIADRVEKSISSADEVLNILGY